MEVRIAYEDFRIAPPRQNLSPSCEMAARSFTPFPCQTVYLVVSPDPYNSNPPRLETAEEVPGDSRRGPSDGREVF